MTAKPVGPRPDDPPGWRLVFAVWDSVRRDGWQPVLKLALLLTLVSAGLCAVVVSLGPWSLVAGAGLGGTALTRLLWHGGREHRLRSGGRHDVGERPGQPRR
jgi:hypothetical protein